MCATVVMIFLQELLPLDPRQGAVWERTRNLVRSMCFILRFLCSSPHHYTSLGTGPCETNSTAVPQVLRTISLCSGEMRTSCVFFTYNDATSSFILASPQVRIQVFRELCCISTFFLCDLFPACSIGSNPASLIMNICVF